jgi:spore germination protein
MTDLVFREIKGLPVRAMLVFLYSISDKNIINQYLIKPLSNISDTKSFSIEQLVEKNITVANYTIHNSIDKMFGAIMKGQSVLIIDGLNRGYAFNTEKYPKRQEGEPTTETVIKGPKIGFIEDINTNIGLVRSICRDPNLKFEKTQIGRRTKTDVVICYIAGVTNSDYIEEMKNRLSKIDTDGIIGSEELAEYLKDSIWSPFPQVSASERLDSFVSGLLDGRVGILTGSTPFSLIVPCSLHILLSSPEDFYENWIISSIIRLTRYIALLLSMTLPAAYVSLISFNVALLPRELVFTIGTTRSEVPFPSFIEVLLMELGVEFLHEASVRLPRGVGQTVGVVGGLILGDAAVRAGVVSPGMVIVIALTAISSFIIPSYSLSLASRVVRIPLMIISTIYGIYGLVMGMILIFIHLVSLTSFSENYLTPWGEYGEDSFKNTFFRMPVSVAKKRPKELRPEDSIRQKNTDNWRDWW